VRELENALEYAVAVCKGQTILREDLPLELQRPAHDSRSGSRPASPPARLSDREQDRLEQALVEHRWHRESAARALGISRATLWRRMREAGFYPQRQA